MRHYTVKNEVTEVMILRTEGMIPWTPAVSVPKQLCLEFCFGECQSLTLPYAQQQILMDQSVQSKSNHWYFAKPTNYTSIGVSVGVGGGGGGGGGGGRSPIV